jgi:type IV pilus assembly protein PilQ
MVGLNGLGFWRSGRMIDDKLGESGMKVTRWSVRRIATSFGVVQFFALLFHVTWVAAASIDGINFSALPGDRFEIKLEFDGQPVNPQGYTVESPARIVLDFADTSSSLAEKKYPLSFDNAQSAVVLSAGTRTRMIVNLKNPVPYEVVMGPTSVTLTVGNEVSASAQPGQSAGTYASTPTSGKSGSISVNSQHQNSVQDIDFARGEKGDGIVTVELANATTPVDVSREGSRIVLSFYRTGLPNALDRKLNVVDFATPIKTIDSGSDGDTSRISIEATGDYDYLAYQADNQYVVRVQPLTKGELEDRKSKFNFTGEKLSLNFQDIEVRSVLQLIADFTDLNLVASDTVTGGITLRLQNVPWDQALDIVLQAKGLDKRQQGNVLMVAPAVEIAEQERLRVEANQQLIELAPLVTDYIRVRYADARELFDLFSVKGGDGGGGGGSDRNATQSILSDRGTAIVDERTNSIVLTDVQEKVDEFRRLIKELDIPIRQVEIDARIVVADTDFRKEIGMRWGISGIRGSDDDGLVFSGRRFAGFSPLAVGDRDVTRNAGGDITGTDPDLSVIHTSAVDLGASESFANLALGLLKDNTFIDWELSAMESDGFGEVISQPKVLTGDKQEAIIKSGVQIPFETGTSSGETDVEFKEAVLQLKVTPQITPDNRIIMNLQINQDTVGEIVPTSSGGSVPTIDVTEVQTQVLVGDGQTLVLGGIFQMEERNLVNKIPVLGDIPYVGKLFRNNLKDTVKREILIFVTPRILDDSLLDQ